MWQLTSAVFLGWSLGANDAANVFGTAVASRMVRFGTAAAICSAFVLLGALLEGQAGMSTYREMSGVSLFGAFIVGLSSAFTVTLMTYLKLPVSTSQAVVGSLIYIGLREGNVHWEPLVKIVMCWVGTPVGGMIFTIILYFIVGKFMNGLNLNLIQHDKYLRWCLITGGAYGAYALGANNVANVTGAFTGPGMLTPFHACLIGGLSIGLGVFTYSRHVMMTVGKEIVRLDGYTAFVVILAQAVTVHIFAEIGVPVSTSQAVVGGVLGIGLVKGVRTINLKSFYHIVYAWVGTPITSFAVSFIVYYLFDLLPIILSQ
ncbi:MAG: anion permease [Thermodesulfobacteriota bacterium]|nr:anion permease [Thermodesulfobacteriota bacterium]